MTHFLYFTLGALGGGSLGAIITAWLWKRKEDEAWAVADIYKRALHSHVKQTAM